MLIPQLKKLLFLFTLVFLLVWSPGEAHALSYGELTSPTDRDFTTPKFFEGLISKNIGLDPQPFIFSDHLSATGEGGRGMLSVRMKHQPDKDYTFNIEGTKYVSVDSNVNLKDGQDHLITFTPQDWNRPKRFYYFPEADNLTSNRINDAIFLLGNNVSQYFNIGNISNTSYFDPTPNSYRIRLIFNRDEGGYWTASRQQTAYLAAAVWEQVINTRLPQIFSREYAESGSVGTGKTKKFALVGELDDMTVFMDSFNFSKNVGGLGGPVVNHRSTSSVFKNLPRAGVVTFDTDFIDKYIFDGVIHELGHALGLIDLLGTNINVRTGTNYIGQYGLAANNNVPIKLDNSGAHPDQTTTTFSVMNYRYQFDPSIPGITTIDLGFLADHGYCVQGVVTTNQCT